MQGESTPRRKRLTVRPGSYYRQQRAERGLPRYTEADLAARARSTANRREARVRAREAAPPAVRPRTLVELACATCGQSFAVKPAKARGAKYCSRACQGVGHTTHGGARGGVIRSEYRIWTGIRTRCFNPHANNYHLYGGRGITMCEAWRTSFGAFLADVGPRPSPRHSIDRIDNDGDYEPTNVRWATHEEQGRNKRTNRLITFRGETHPLVVWANKIGLTTAVLKGRLYEGWSVERALTQPLEVHRRSPRP